jgi:hypothetical protein
VTQEIHLGITANGEAWLFIVENDPRSLVALIEVLIAYERDPESDFNRCHSNLILDALSHQLLESVASRRTVENSKNTATKFSTGKSL